MIERMKKQLFLIALVGFLFAAGTASAQTKVGGFLGYGSELEKLGLGINGEFGLTDKIAISPSFMFWLVENANVWELNVNANYYFTKAGSVDLYGIGGINLFNAKVDGAGDGNSEVGINLGIGFNFNVGKSWQPFSEAKFVLGDADQLALLFGVKFQLK
jgi:outer membrane immunogenic protein